MLKPPLQEKLKGDMLEAKFTSTHAELTKCQESGTKCESRIKTLETDVRKVLVYV